jgi:hypothetical protein
LAQASFEGISSVETEPARVFDEIVAPVMPLIVEEAQKLSHDAGKYTLSFQPFTLNLLFALIKGIKSIKWMARRTIERYAYRQCRARFHPSRPSSTSVMASM